MSADVQASLVNIPESAHSNEEACSAMLSSKSRLCVVLWRRHGLEALSGRESASSEHHVIPVSQGAVAPSLPGSTDSASFHVAS